MKTIVLLLYRRTGNNQNYVITPHIIGWERKCETHSGTPGLVDRVFAFRQEVEGSTTIGRTGLNDFSDPIDQDIRIQCVLIKPAKLYMCTQKHYKHDVDGRTARPWFRYENRITTTSEIFILSINYHTSKPKFINMNSNRTVL